MPFRIVQIAGGGLGVQINLQPMGAYSPTEIYSPGMAVSYESSSYAAIKNTQGNLPTDTAYWMVVALKGVDGAGLAADYIAAIEGATLPSALNPFVTKTELLGTAYFPAIIRVIAGSLNSGDEASVVEAGDGNTLRVDETAGGLTVEYEFQGIPDFNAIAYRTRYAGGAGHVLQQLGWKWGTSEQVVLADSTGPQDALTWGVTAVPDAAVYIGTGADAGKVLIRRHHVAPFNAAHYYEADYVALVKSTAGNAIPIPVQAQAENLADTSGNPFLWPITRLLQFVTAWWATIKTILGQYDTRTDLTPADGATATLNYALGNAFKIIAPDTGPGMDFTISLSNVPAGVVTSDIQVNIVVGTNVPTISLTGKGTNVTLPTLTASRNNIWIISTWDNGTTLQVNDAGKF